MNTGRHTSGAATYPGVGSSPRHEWTNSAAADFRRDGFVVLRDVVDAELVEEIRRDITMLCDDEPAPDSGVAFRRVVNVHARYGGLRRHYDSKDLGQVVARITGWNGVRLYHDMVAVKRPSDPITAWHQDAHYSPLEPGDVVGLWAPVVKVSESMGGLELAVGSHRLGLLPLPSDKVVDSIANSKTLDEHFSNVVRRSGLEVRRPDINPGDVVMTHSLTLHRAGANTSNKPREAVASFYYREGARILDVLSAYQESDRKQYLADCTEGEFANGVSNPIIYREDA